MGNLYKVLIIRPTGKLLNTYEVDNLEVLKDDLTSQYSNLNVNKLIEDKQYTDINNYKYLLHHFNW